MHNNSNIRNKQMVTNTCKIYPFSKFRGLMPAKWPFFLVSRIRASHWKNTPFFAKMGTSVVYVLVGSRGIRFGRDWARRARCVHAVDAQWQLFARHEH